MPKGRLRSLRKEDGTTEIQLIAKDGQVAEIVGYIVGNNQKYWAELFVKAPVLVKFLDSLRLEHFFDSNSIPEKETIFSKKGISKMLHRFWETRDVSIFDKYDK